jgi:hypothetical protein
MGINISSAALSHIKAVANKALYSDNGVMLYAKSNNEALKYRSLFFKMRSKDRTDSMKIYPVDHPQHGASPYDCLETSLQKDDVTGEWVVLLQNMEIGFQNLKVVDAATGETIKPEDLI